MAVANGAYTSRDGSLTHAFDQLLTTLNAQGGALGRVLADGLAHDAPDPRDDAGFLVATVQFVLTTSPAQSWSRTL